ncbi:unnamed protein product [Ectocarpus sp. 12 AP-2014]
MAQRLIRCTGNRGREVRAVGPYIANKISQKATNRNYLRTCFDGRVSGHRTRYHIGLNTYPVFVMSLGQRFVYPWRMFVGRLGCRVGGGSFLSGLSGQFVPCGPLQVSHGSCFALCTVYCCQREQKKATYTPWCLARQHLVTMSLACVLRYNYA